MNKTYPRTSSLSRRPLGLICKYQRSDPGFTESTLIGCKRASTNLVRFVHFPILHRTPLRGSKTATPDWPVRTEYSRSTSTVSVQRRAPPYMHTPTLPLGVLRGHLTRTSNLGTYLMCLPAALEPQCFQLMPGTCKPAALQICGP